MRNVFRNVDVIEPGRWLAGIRPPGLAAAREVAAGLALDAGTIAPPGERTMAPPGERTMAPPRVAAGAADFFARGFFAAGVAAGFAAALGLALGLAAGAADAIGRLGPPFAPRVASMLRTVRAAA